MSRRKDMSPDKAESDFVVDAVLVHLHLLNDLVRVHAKQRHQVLDLSVISIQNGYLFCCSTPVLAGKGVHRVLFDSKIHAPLKRFLEHLGPPAMPGNDRETLLFCPASVAIHNHSHMVLHELDSSHRSRTKDGKGVTTSDIVKKKWRSPNTCFKQNQVTAQSRAP